MVAEQIFQSIETCTVIWLVLSNQIYELFKWSHENGKCYELENWYKVHEKLSQNILISRHWFKVIKVLVVFFFGF